MFRNYIHRNHHRICSTHLSLGSAVDPNNLGRTENVRVIVVTWDLHTGSVISANERPLCFLGSRARLYITHSTDEKMVGVLYQGILATTISIYNILSGEYTHDVYHRAYWSILDRLMDSHRLLDIIWTHGKSLRFVTATLTTATGNPGLFQEPLQRRSTLFLSRTSFNPQDGAQ